MLYNRYISITVGKQNDKGIQIDNLKISCDIEMVSTEDPNVCVVKVYNTNETTRKILDGKNLKLTVIAGYENSLNGIGVTFIGDIVEVNTVVKGPNIITTITARDGYKKLREVTFTKTYEKGSSGIDVLTDMLNKFELPFADKLDSLSINDKALNNGFSFSGKLKDAVTKMTDFLGLDWSIYNEKVKVVIPSNGDLKPVFYVSPNTGLIGSPEKIKIKTADGKDRDGWQFSSRFIHKLEVQGKIQIESRFTPRSTCIINKISHSIDNYEGDFVSLIEAYEK